MVQSNEKDKEALLVRRFSGGIRLSVRARPGATGGRARKPKIVPLADEGWAVEIAVAEAPEGGKANKALIEVLARALGCHKNAVSVKAGQTGRLKVFEVCGEPEALFHQAAAWIASMDLQ